MGEETKTEIVRYPQGFLWGAATAAYQVEGGLTNQWSEWEKAQAAELARTAEQRLGWLPSWQNVKTEAEKPENYISGVGVEHYTRYLEDFAIMQELGLNAFRFGIEWSRLEPEEGQWDAAAIQHYKDYITELISHGLEPIPTLWHWTMPTWFVRKGGFEKRRNLVHFERFVQKVTKELLDDIRYVVTINEPSVYASFSYLGGEWVPQRKNPFVFAVVYYNLVLAHKRAYKTIKATQPQIQVGIAAQLACMKPARPTSLLDKLVTNVYAYAGNWWFLNRLRGTQDFVGLNYYFTNYYRGFKMKNPTQPLNDLGWYMEPAAIGPLIEEVYKRYRVPVLVTENGLADTSDEKRIRWLSQTMPALERVIAKGVPLIGYLHWSLLDNFEWKYGWWPQFGLVSVDRHQGMRRQIKPSARWYARYIHEAKK